MTELFFSKLRGLADGFFFINNCAYYLMLSSHIRDFLEDCVETLVVR